MKNIMKISGLSEIYQQFQCFIFDLWGVLHHGNSIEDPVNDCLERLTKSGKELIFLSNSPNPVNSVRQQLSELKISKDINYQIMTSGESALIEYNQNHPDKIIKAYFIGPSHHYEIKQACPFEWVDDIKFASVIITSGIETYANNINHYDEILKIASLMRLPMHVLNPDEYALVKGKKVICAGTMGNRYQKLGGLVKLFGKPHPHIYETITNIFSIDIKHTLAVGDSLIADIAGATAFGIESVLITSGIHNEKINPEKYTESCQQLFSYYQHYPDYILTNLKWE